MFFLHLFRRESVKFMRENYPFVTLFHKEIRFQCSLVLIGFPVNRCKTDIRLELSELLNHGFGCVAGVEYVIYNLHLGSGNNGVENIIGILKNHLCVS